MNNNKWQFLRTDLLVKRKSLEIRVDLVLDPNGNQTHRVLVNTKRDSVIIVPVHDDHLYLVGQWRYAVDTYSWEFPSGGIKGKESPIEAARRELGEEVGLEAVKWSSLGYFYPASGFLNSKIEVFLACDLLQTSASYEPTIHEDLAVKQVGLEEFKAMVRDNTIYDGFTLAAASFYFECCMSKNDID